MLLIICIPANKRLKNLTKSFWLIFVLLQTYAYNDHQRRLAFLALMKRNFPMPYQLHAQPEVLFHS